MGSDNRTKGDTRYAEYSVERLMSLKKIIQRQFESEHERGKRYAILVDREMVVGVTTDPDEFDTYLDFVEPHTTQIEVRLYFGGSPHHNKHIFRTAQHGLSGLNQQLKSEEERRLWELEHEVKQYKKKAAKYKELSVEQEQTIEELEKQNQEFKEKFSLGAVAKEVVAVIQPLFNGHPKQIEGAENELQGEVEIEGISNGESEISEAAILFDKLMKGYGVANPKEVVKINEILLQRPDLQQAVMNMINKQ